MTLAVDGNLSVTEANRIAATLQQELHEHLPPLGAVTVQFDLGGSSAAAPAVHHHAPEPFHVFSPVASGELAIVDTPDGERMRLTVKHHMDGLVAVVNIKRPDGTIERLPLEGSEYDHHSLQSTIAPAEPHEFDADLVLAAGEQREVLLFRMEEPEGHHH